MNTRDPVLAIAAVATETGKKCFAFLGMDVDEGREGRPVLIWNPAL